MRNARKGTGTDRDCCHCGKQRAHIGSFGGIRRRLDAGTPLAPAHTGGGTARSAHVSPREFEQLGKEVKTCKGLVAALEVLRTAFARVTEEESLKRPEEGTACLKLPQPPTESHDATCGKRMSGSKQHSPRHCTTDGPVGRGAPE